MGKTKSGGKTVGSNENFRYIAKISLQIFFRYNSEISLQIIKINKNEENQIKKQNYFF